MRKEICLTLSLSAKAQSLLPLATSASIPASTKKESEIVNQIFLLVLQQLCACEMDSQIIQRKLTLKFSHDFFNYFSKSVNFIICLKQ
jgi:hypothetical protein